MNKVVIVANSNKTLAIKLAKEVMQFLSSKKIDSHIMYTQDSTYEVDSSLKPDAVVSIGGDGTLLSVVYNFHTFHVPIFAINAGDLGFITPFSVDDWKNGLNEFINGRASIKSKLLLKATVYLNNEKIKTGIALNEISVQKDETNHLLRLDAFLENECFAHGLAADGVIIATPTGSTAYSMSAGGSVLSSDTDAFIFTPNSPFMAIDRGIVFPAKSVIKIRISEKQKASSALVSADGVPIFHLNKSHELVIKKLEGECRMVANPTLSDASRIGEKMMWKPLG